MRLQRRLRAPRYSAASLDARRRQPPPRSRRARSRRRPRRGERFPLVRGRRRTRPAAYGRGGPRARRRRLAAVLALLRLPGPGSRDRAPGRHEGDWELVQFRVTARAAGRGGLRPALGAERCGFGAVTRRDGRPVVYAAHGSHASYLRAGARDRMWPDPNDEADGRGAGRRPRLVEITRDLAAVDAPLRRPGATRARAGASRRSRTPRPARPSSPIAGDPEAFAAARPRLPGRLRRGRRVRRAREGADGRRRSRSRCCWCWSRYRIRTRDPAASSRGSTGTSRRAGPARGSGTTRPPARSRCEPVARREARVPARPRRSRTSRHLPALERLQVDAPCPTAGAAAPRRRPEIRIVPRGAHAPRPDRQRRRRPRTRSSTRVATRSARRAAGARGTRSGSPGRAAARAGRVKRPSAPVVTSPRSAYARARCAAAGRAPGSSRPRSARPRRRSAARGRSPALPNADRRAAAPVARERSRSASRRRARPLEPLSGPPTCDRERRALGRRCPPASVTRSCSVRAPGGELESA